jgi:hypothetical protein
VCGGEAPFEPLPPGRQGLGEDENQEYWRYEMERESAMNRPRVEQFV